MLDLLICGVTLILPDRLLPAAALGVRGGRIAWLGPQSQAPAARQTVHGPGYLSPGFIDLHTHGAGGGSFLSADPGQFRTGLRTHLTHGATTVLPTVVIRTAAQMEQLAALRTALAGEAGLPNFPGYFLEGPYASHDPAVQGFVRKDGPDPVITEADYGPILAAGEGHILRWMAAPELEGAAGFARALRAKGIRPCMGHCAPVYQQVLDGMTAGFDCTVHLYSAMSTITRENGWRRPGLLETTLLLDDLMSEIVADGCHVPAPLLRLAIKCKGYDRLMLISDSCPFAGAADGQRFTMLGCDVLVEDGVCKLADRTAFAGSVVCGADLARTVYQQCGVPLWAAVRMATRTPARYMGWGGVKGELTVGADADLVLLDDQLQVRQVWLAGAPQQEWA